MEDKEKVTLYTDATGALPAILLNGHQYFFIAYDYDTNYIFSKPIRNVTDTAIFEAFNEVFTELDNKGYKPRFNVTYNQATGALKYYMVKEYCRWQYFEPSNRRFNAEERSIQKN